MKDYEWKMICWIVVVVCLLATMVFILFCNKIDNVRKFDMIANKLQSIQTSVDALDIQTTTNKKDNNYSGEKNSRK